LQTWLLLSGCILTYGLAVFLMKVAGQQVGPYTSVVCNLVGYVAVIAAVVRKADYHLTWGHLAAAAVGALYVLGNMAYYKLSETVDVSRLAPVTALYVGVPIILGWVLLRETVTAQRIVGIALAAASLYFLMAPERG